MVALCLLRPSVTDFTLADAQYATLHALTCGGALCADPPLKRQFSFLANPAGTWTLAVGAAWNFAAGGCIGPNRGDIDPTCVHDVAYELTGRVQRYTRTVLRSPGLVRAGQRVTLRGRVTGADSGRVELQYKAGRRWRGFGFVALRPDGRFVRSTRFPSRATYYNRAVYRGDAGHRPSVSNVVVTRAV